MDNGNKVETTLCNRNTIEIGLRRGVIRSTMQQGKLTSASIQAAS